VRRAALLAALAGSAVLAGFSVAALPFSHGLFRAPRTPYGDSAVWVLLRSAEPLIPPGASVLIRVEPPNLTDDSYFHRFGVGLLPGRRIVPAALWGVPTPADLQAEAGYEVVVGEKPQSAPGRLLLEIPEGTVWRIGR
jgi:hypothetical protein